MKLYCQLPQGIKAHPNSKKKNLNKYIKVEKIKQIHQVICNKYLYYNYEREQAKLKNLQIKFILQ